ncbi:FtsX-like permease family protein [Actinokineospora auranticolor]|uniref:Putative ABC transport system permease protein n=1 Tax=Actinokineospora auranticolor TaxID=155976 RepID=A0A2S6GSW3_9PSEU|nr:ABC transporter permease [Actinokineospora auranticolor]PPK68314.1 putative ABC transport system permease protein [Actinokineospora auranticolor]
MLALSWQTVKSRLGGFVGAFLAVLCGTAVVAACGVLIESGISSGVPTERYAAAPVVVGGKQSVRPEGADVLSAQSVAEQPTVPADLVARVAAVPGVRSAVGDVDFAAAVITPDGRVPAGPPVRGHGWESVALAPFTLAGDAPAGPDQVVLDQALAERAGVRTGDQVRIETSAGTREYRVTGLTSPGLSRQTAVFFTTERAAELFGRPGRLHAVAVLTDGDADAVAERLESALGDAVTVTTGVDRGMIEFSDVGQGRTILLAISGSFAGVALLVMMFVVSSTLALSVAQRRREFALLRAIAATPRQIRSLIAAETTLVAVVAGVLGGVGGLFVAGWLRDAFASIGVLPGDFELTLGPLPPVGAVLLGLGAARLAAWSAARRPSRISPVEALGEAAIEPRGLGRTRTSIGVVVLVLGLGAATAPLFLRGPVAAGVSVMSALLIVIGLAVLGPLVVGRAIRLVAGPLSRFSRVGGYLAAANSVANTRRLAAAVTPLMLAVGFAIAQFFSAAVVDEAAQRETDRATVADHVLTGQIGGLPPAVTAAVREVPGVAAVTPLVRTQVITATDVAGQVEVHTVAALGVDGAQVRGALDLGDVRGDLGALTGDAVALSQAEADWQEKAIGDQLAVHLGDGTPITLRVVATYTHDQAFGDYVLPATLARAHTTDQLDTSVLVRREPTADPAAVTAALRGLTARFPTLTVADRAAMEAAGSALRDQQFWVNMVALGVILGYIVISVANTLVMTTTQRAREFALLRLVGATRRQVRRMMLTEAVVSAGIAIVIGSLIPVIPLALLGIGVSGSPLPAGPVTVYLGIIGAAALLGLLSVVIPTRVALRPRPIDAIGVRE